MTQGLSPRSWGSFQPSTQQLAPGGIPPGCRQMGRADGEGSTREFSSRRARGGLSPKCRGSRMLMTDRDTWWPCGRELAPARPRYTSMGGTVVEPSLWGQEPASEPAACPISSIVGEPLTNCLVTLLSSASKDLTPQKPTKQIPTETPHLACPCFMRHKLTMFYYRKSP